MKAQNRNVLPPAGEFGLDSRILDWMRKGWLPPSSRILDAGCGTGRNLGSLAKAGFAVVGVDSNADAAATARFLGSADSGFGVAAARCQALPFRDGFFDAVLCVDVLHFASGRPEFEDMLRGLWRVLCPGGFFYARMDCRDAMGTGDAPWFLADRGMLEHWATDLGFSWLEPYVITSPAPGRLQAEIAWRKVS